MPLRLERVGLACAHLPRPSDLAPALPPQAWSASALPVESHEALAEGWLRTLRDVGRALLWLLSGLHGGSLNLIFHPRRVADARARGEWWASGAEATRREALVVERFRAALAE